MALVAVISALPILMLLLDEPFQHSVFLSIELTVLWLALFGAMLYSARVRLSAPAMEQRWRMACARAWFRVELAKPMPVLEDVWYPYLVALELGGAMDRWFQAFGGAATGQANSFEVGSESRSSFGSSTWSGGGGNFGGAGATGTWVASVAGMAASTPSRSDSSSSSFSSSSSSRSSSSGGGGGAW